MTEQDAVLGPTSAGARVRRPSCSPDQVRGIDAFNAARRAAAREEAAASAQRSREMRLDLARRMDVVRRQHEALVRRTEEHMRSSAHLLQAHAPARAVLVHRDPRFLDRVCAVLEQSGIDVVVRLDNGADAVGAVVAEQPDLLLVEDKLPMLGGAEVLRQVLQYAPRTLAAGTAWSDSSVAELLEAGARSAYTRRVTPADVARGLCGLVGSDPRVRDGEQEPAPALSKHPSHPDVRMSMTAENTTQGLSRRSLFRAAGVAAAAAGVATAGGASADLLPGAGAGTAPGAPAETLKLARVWAGKTLLPGFDDTHVVYADGSAQYLLWPGDLAKLDALGHRYEIEVSDLVAHDAALAKAAGPRTTLAQPGESPTRDYRQLADFERDMKALVAKYPDFARMIELPYKTLQGRTVFGMEIAKNVAAKDGRPVFYQDGCHHAREWPAAEVPLMWAYDLLENYTTDAAIRNIVDNVRNIIVPVVNADSFAFTRSAPPVETGEVGGVTNPLPPEAILLGGQARYTRKNRRPLLGKRVGPGLVTEVNDPAYGSTTLGGVDPNRNYSYFWGDDKAGSSSDVFSQTYRGSDPLSEQETKNVSWLLKGRQVLAMNTNHTSGDLLLWAWGDTTDDAPDNDLLEGLGRAMATYNGYTPQKSIELYVTTGTCSDYAYGVLGSIGYTFEHAGSSFHPPYETTVPAMYAKNRQAFILLATYVCMTPEQRAGVDLGLSAAAQKQLDAFGLKKDRLAHGIIKGRAVRSQGNGGGAGLGVAGATLTLTKLATTPLWKTQPAGPAAAPGGAHQHDGDRRRRQLRLAREPLHAPGAGLQGREGVLAADGHRPGRRRREPQAVRRARRRPRPGQPRRRLATRTPRTAPPGPVRAPLGRALPRAGTAVSGTSGCRSGPGGRSRCRWSRRGRRRAGRGRSSAPHAAHRVRLPSASRSRAARASSARPSAWVRAPPAAQPLLTASARSGDPATRATSRACRACTHAAAVASSNRSGWSRTRAATASLTAARGPA